MHPLASFNICKTSRCEFAKVSVNSVFDISSEIKKGRNKFETETI